MFLRIFLRVAIKYSRRDEIENKVDKSKKKKKERKKDRKTSLPAKFFEQVNVSIKVMWTNNAGFAQQNDILYCGIERSVFLPFDIRNIYGQDCI